MMAYKDSNIYEILNWPQNAIFFCVQWMSIFVYSNLLETYFSYFLQVLSC